jgi:xylulokinase
MPHLGWVEQDMEAIWDALVDALASVTGKLAPEQRKAVAALALSTQRDTLVTMDADGKPMRNAITWMDSRGDAECRQLESSLGAEKVYRITGVPISTIWTYTFILWLKNNEPDLYARARCFGLVHDFVLRRLGAEGHFLDYSNACETMLFDFQNLAWSRELLGFSGLAADRLPQLVPSGVAVGKLAKSMAAATGLPAETLLVSGGGDQQCAALGAGAIEEGDVEIGIGTAANILAVVNQPMLDEKQRLLCHCANLTNQWVMEGALLACGPTLSWLKGIAYRDVAGGADDSFFDVLNREVAEGSIPGANGIILTPHFEGAGSPYWDSHSRGLILGLTLSTSRADLARAAMEGIALEIKKSLNLLQEWNVAPKRIIVTGGASRSPVWSQIQADIYGVPVVVLKEPDSPAIGAAILAGLGSGVFKNAEEGVKALVKRDRVFEPDAEKSSVYSQLLDLNERAFLALKEAGVFRDLHKLKTAGK